MSIFRRSFVVCAALAVTVSLASAATAPQPSVQVTPFSERALAGATAVAPVTGRSSRGKTIAAALRDAGQAFRSSKLAARSGTPGQQLASVGTAVAAMSPGGLMRDAVARLRGVAGPDVRLRARSSNSTVLQVKGGRLQSALPGPDGDLATAQAFLRRERQLFGLEDPDAELRVRLRQSDRVGQRHLRMSQYFKGIPVWPAELVVHMDRHGSVGSANGFYVRSPTDIETNPTIDAQQARSRAQQAIGAGQAAEPVLIIYAATNDEPRLAWRVRIPAALTERWLVVVDAHSGDILTSFNEVATANVQGSGTDLYNIQRPLNVWSEAGAYYLVDTSKPMFDAASNPPDPNLTRGGISVLDFRNAELDQNSQAYHIQSSSPDGGFLADGVSASLGLSETYDYYREHHGRDSLDGQGGSMLAVVRVGRNYQNAFWNGQVMAFGDGLPFAGALDIVAHELTHGVIQHTANLIYQDQSGALNEALADIFGEMTEARANDGQHDWLFGAQLGEASRSFSDPSSITVGGGCNRSLPSTMSEYFAPNAPGVCGRISQQDQGGVHLNSSIINHAYYLLAAGLDGGLGLSASERIFYRALAFYLTPNSQFIDARLACIQAAEDLFGQGSNEAVMTGRAFDAVEVFDGDGSSPPAQIPEVQGADSTLMVFWDNASGEFFLGRREEALGDPAQGHFLSLYPVVQSKPSVRGDGSLAAYVDSRNDVCFVDTEGLTEDSCAGVPGSFASIALSPDGRVAAAVFLDAFGYPYNQIEIIDLEQDVLGQTITLVAPAQDAIASNTISYADAMDFSSDRGFLVYDALNEINFSNGQSASLWSIYLLDLVRNRTLTLVAPIPGANISYPSLSNTSDSYITFDVKDLNTGDNVVYAANLFTGTIGAIDEFPDYGVPGFTGDDRALVYSVPDTTPSGRSLVRTPLGTDKMSSASAPASWLPDADFGVIYRRGAYTGPGQVARLVASNLPVSRSVQVGAMATAFATMINTGTSELRGCSIVPITGVPGTFFYRTTDPATNAIVGSPNDPATIGPGASQSFVFGFAPSEAFGSIDVELQFDCESAVGQTAAVIPGVNTILLSASNTPVPDIIALVATPTMDGIIDIPGVNGSAAFAVASANVGVAGTVRASADTGTASLPVDLTICETDASARCLSPAARQVTFEAGAGSTPTFAVFVNGREDIAFDPAANRIFVRFVDTDGTVRGATSVAVRTR